MVPASTPAMPAKYGMDVMHAQQLASRQAAEEPPGKRKCGSSAVKEALALVSRGSPASSLRTSEMQTTSSSILSQSKIADLNA